MSHAAKNSGPTMRRAQVATDTFLYEINVPRPETQAIVLVFDFSDSCEQIRAVFERLPSFAQLFPRSWPLWVYRLSRSAPLDYGDFNVGDLQDAVKELEALIPDGLALRDLQNRGSMFRPVLEAIERRLTDQSITGTLVFVITDGELLDSSSIPSRPTTRVIGLRTGGKGASGRWPKVLDQSPLLLLDDERLADLISHRANAFFGRCTVKARAVNSSELMVVDATTQRMKSASAQFEHNFSASPLLLVAKTPSGSDAGIEVRCQPMRSHDNLAVALVDGQPGAESQALVSELLTQSQRPIGEILAAVRPDDAKWVNMMNAFDSALTLTKTGAKWGETAKQFLTDDQNADALLVIRRSSAANAELCCVGLKRGATPALHWPAQSSILNLKLLQEVTLHFDRMEARWTLTTGSTPAELNPTGSTALKLPVKIPDGLIVEVLFSGDLT